VGRVSRPKLSARKQGKFTPKQSKRVSSGSEGSYKGSPNLMPPLENVQRRPVQKALCGGKAESREERKSRVQSKDSKAKEPQKTKDLLTCHRESPR